MQCDERKLLSNFDYLLDVNTDSIDTSSSTSLYQVVGNFQNEVHKLRLNIASIPIPKWRSAYWGIKV